MTPTPYLIALSWLTSTIIPALCMVAFPYAFFLFAKKRNRNQGAWLVAGILLGAFHPVLSFVRTLSFFLGIGGEFWLGLPIALWIVEFWLWVTLAVVSLIVALSIKDRFKGKIAEVTLPMPLPPPDRE